MPPPLSATATRVATHWAVDALAGDEGLDFSLLKALVAASPECLTGAPEATRERVALRCLQEVASIAPGGDATTTAGVVRVEAARSCEDLLLGLIGEVGSSGTLEKDMLPPFSQDLKNIICMKKSTLPETSFELLKEIVPEIASMAPPSQLEQNVTNNHDNDQSLCSSHNHVNKGNAEFQQETSANLVVGIESRNLDHLQEDDAAAVGLAARPPEESPVDENVQPGAVHASAGCDVTLQGSTTESLSKDTEFFAATIRPQSPREQHPNAPPHNSDAERLHDGGARDQSLKPSCEGLDTHAAVAPTVDRSSDALPTNATEPGDLPESVTPEDTTIISQPHRSTTDTNVLQHENGEKVNQVLDDVNASIEPVEKDHVDEDLTLQAASDLLSVKCNDAIQGGQSETSHMPGNATEHTAVFEEQNGDNTCPEFSGADKVHETQPDNTNVLEKNTVPGGLNVQATPLSQNCNIALHDKISEVICSFVQNAGRGRTDAQKNSCSTSERNITQDGTATSTTNTLNKSNLGDASAGIPHGPSSDDRLHGIAAAAILLMTNKMPFLPKDQEINDSLEGLSQQDVCIKCGEAGQLLKCSGCLLAAHDSCFGSSVTFHESDLFYCPVCFYTKATEAYQKARKVYCEARKNLATFLGTSKVAGQQDELLTGVLPRPPNREGQSNVSESSKRKNIHQQEATNLSHQDEDPDQQRKKQKVYKTGNDYTEEIVTEKGNSRNQVEDAEAERQQLEENEEAGNINSSHKTRRSSKNRCHPPANQEVEADEEDGPTKSHSHQSNDSDEIEATSSNDSGKRSSPPWRKMRHNKSRLQEKETVVSSKSRKIITQHNQHLSSPSTKRNYAPQKRYSNPVAPTGRRSKLSWTEEEETTLKEAMEKFGPKDDGPIPWVQILEYGRDVFHRTRLPSDLRVKWRNVMKKAGS